MANDRPGQSSRAKMTALIVAEQRPKALHKILWTEISDGLNCENALMTSLKTKNGFWFGLQNATESESDLLPSLVTAPPCVIPLSAQNIDANVQYHTAPRINADMAGQRYQQHIRVLI